MIFRRATKEDLIAGKKLSAVFDDNGKFLGQVVMEDNGKEKTRKTVVSQGQSLGKL
jgi:hypothetical protein